MIKTESNRSKYADPGAAGICLSVRDTLLDQPNVKDAAVDYDKGLAYVLPDGNFDTDKAIAALGEDGKYTAKIQ